ncbi:CDP-diacylglycerol--glycerol-3-phosphate 3-phosphatidyltransferase, partial [Bacillus cereus]|nr:CDP-diacylglycerol--glycerol-3-phosphate 3-phosphatidyltransferase [Bacillus cereus]
LLHDVTLNLVHITVADIFIGIALIFTVISGWDYFWKNRAAFVKSK